MIRGLFGGCGHAWACCAHACNCWIAAQGGPHGACVAYILRRPPLWPAVAP